MTDKDEERWAGEGGYVPALTESEERVQYLLDTVGIYVVSLVADMTAPEIRRGRALDEEGEHRVKVLSIVVGRLMEHQRSEGVHEFLTTRQESLDNMHPVRVLSDYPIGTRDQDLYDAVDAYIRSGSW